MGGPWDRIFSEQWHEGQLRLARAMVDVVPYVMLAFSAILTPILYHEHWETGSPIPPLVLCALAGLWTLWMYTLHPAWRDRPRLMGVFVGVLLVIMTVMVAGYSWLGFYTFTGYYYVYRLVGSWPWRFACLGLLAGLSGISQGLGLQGAFSLARVLVLGGTISVNVLGACALAWFTWASYKQDLLRMRLFDELAETNARLESTIAENTGLHRQLLAQAREAGMLDERQRMAQEIHDTLAQGLTGIITQLQAAEEAADDPVERRRHYDTATRLARESLSEARRSVHALRPEPLEQARLGEALAGVARRWSALHGVPVHVTTAGPARPVRPEAELALLRTAQEALANVAKHAAATRVDLTLSFLTEEVVLDVRDDGQGFNPASVGSREPAYAVSLAARSPHDSTLHGDPAADGSGQAPSGGFGLVAMRQRIEGVSGTLRVDSAPGAGTAISASVPVQPTEAAGETA
ncbi:MAG TPA: sensor histidine kinase [Trebonia sp.]|nr:sensor histidine kinase [Trebonia sp.]